LVLNSGPPQFIAISTFDGLSFELIETIFQIPPLDFLHHALDTCLKLIPEPESFTPEEQSVGLLLFSG